MSSKLILFIALCAIGRCFFPEEIDEIKNSRRWVNPKQYLSIKSVDTPTRDGSIPVKGGDTGTLTVSPLLITDNTEWVTVSWSNLSYSGRYDWIGLFKFVKLL